MMTAEGVEEVRTDEAGRGDERYRLAGYHQHYEARDDNWNLTPGSRSCPSARLRGSARPSYNSEIYSCSALLEAICRLRHALMKYCIHRKGPRTPSSAALPWDRTTHRTRPSVRPCLLTSLQEEWCEPWTERKSSYVCISFHVTSAHDNDISHIGKQMRKIMYSTTSRIRIPNQLLINLKRCSFSLCLSTLIVNRVFLVLKAAHAKWTNVIN